VGAVVRDDRRRGVEEVLVEQFRAADDEQHHSRPEREGAEETRRVAERRFGRCFDDAEGDDAEHDREPRDEARRDQFERRLVESTLALRHGPLEYLRGGGSLRHEGERGWRVIRFRFIWYR